MLSWFLSCMNRSSCQNSGLASEKQERLQLDSLPLELQKRIYKETVLRAIETKRFALAWFLARSWFPALDAEDRQEWVHFLSLRHENPTLSEILTLRNLRPLFLGVQSLPFKSFKQKNKKVFVSHLANFTIPLANGKLSYDSEVAKEGRKNGNNLFVTRERRLDGMREGIYRLIVPETRDELQIMCVTAMKNELSIVYDHGIRTSLGVDYMDISQSGDWKLEIISWESGQTPLYELELLGPIQRPNTRSQASKFHLEW